MFGVYIAGVGFFGGISLFGVTLGGKDSDLWKPIVAGLFWPIVIPWLFYSDNLPEKGVKIPS
jgi:hypothetical protein